MSRFHLYLDTSKFATESALYQNQNSKPKLITFVRKQLPEAAQNYSFTELELYGLAINIVNFAHLFKRVDFDAIVCHLALTHIIKSKSEPATARIERLLEVLSSYSLDPYYIKGKDMILSDFVPRQKHDSSDPHKIIQISFNMQKVLHANCYYIHENEQKRYMIQTRSQARTSGTILPKVHGVDKGVDSNIQPEKTKNKASSYTSSTCFYSKDQFDVKPRLGQGRTVIRRR